MYVQPFHPGNILPPTPQGEINQWDGGMGLTRAGLGGLGGLGCADCGGTCCGGSKPPAKFPGWFGLGDVDFSAVPAPAGPGVLETTYSLTSILLHLGALWIGYKLLKMAFWGAGAKQRRAGIQHAKQRRARAIAAGNDAVRKAKRKPRITFESFAE